MRTIGKHETKQAFNRSVFFDYTTSKRLPWKRCNISWCTTFGSGITTKFQNSAIHSFHLIYDATCSTTGCGYSLFKISPFSISAATLSRVSKDFEQSAPLQVLADTLRLVASGIW